MAVANQQVTVAALRQKYPTPLGQQHAAFLIELARTVGAKLLRKDTGSHVLLPQGIYVSQDILVFDNGRECYDVLSDAEGLAIPSWQPKGSIAGQYVDVGTFPAPPPAAGDIETRVTELEHTVGQLIQTLRSV